MEIGLGERFYAKTRQAQGGDYTVDPELSAYVAEVGARVAAVSDRPQLPYEFHVLNSSVPNAWALPGGKIAVNRGLLVEMEDESELAALLGHEITHAAARHSAQSVERGMLLQGVVLATAVAFKDEKYGEYARGGVQLTTQLIDLRFGRDDEREADHYGTLYMHRAGYDPRGAVALQEVLLERGRAGEPNWLDGLFASHPHSEERWITNRQTAAALLAAGGPAGEIGRDRFQAVVGPLIAQRELYEAHDEGRVALAEGRVEESQALAQRALDGEPREPLFHILQGDLFVETARYPEAVTSYGHAIDLDADYFLPYLSRGQARRALGDHRGAVADLERSAELLPTGDAQLALGELAEARGDDTAALAYYRAVAGLQGVLGARARTSLARLELPGNPAAFLSARPRLASDGSLWVDVENRAPLSVRGVVVEFEYGSGPQARSSQSAFSGEVAAGQARSWRTRIGPIHDPAILAQLKLRVVAAEVVPGSGP